MMHDFSRTIFAISITNWDKREKGSGKYGNTAQLFLMGVL
jgi:hypothetical protein